MPTKESPPAKEEEAPAAEADAAPVEANEPAAAPAPTPAPAAPVAARPVVSAEPADDGAPLSGRATAKQRVQLTLEKARLRGEINDPAARAFLAHYTALTEGKDGTIPEGLIAPATMIPTYEQLQDVDSIGDVLSKTVVLKLNGGLGTSMGLTKAKSLLEVKEGKRFLDLIAAQQNELKKQGDVGFMLMNSYSTSEDTKQALASANLGNWESIQLMQNKVPKITEDFEVCLPCTSIVNTYFCFSLMSSQSWRRIRFFSKRSGQILPPKKVHSLRYAMTWDGNVQKTQPTLFFLIFVSTPLFWRLGASDSTSIYIPPPSLTVLHLALHPSLHNTPPLQPAAQSDDELNWCPPGHGDLYAALFGSGRVWFLECFRVHPYGQRR